MTDAADLIKNVRLPEAHVPLCLRGDLLSEVTTLERDLAVAKQSDASNSLAAGGQARVIAERLESVLTQVRKETRDFHFRAMPKREFRALQEDHSPREGNLMDQATGVNIDTLQAPLISACCIDPAMTVEQAEDLLDLLTEGQIMELLGCAMRLNRGRVDIPKFETASAILARPELRSKPPEPGGSAASGSSGGSLAG